MKCVPCRKGDKPLSLAEIQQKLAGLDGWVLNAEGKKIRKRWKFKNFAEAISFVNRVAEVAEAEDHHPDVSFGWGYAEIVFTTHAIDGLHENDFVMAREVDKSHEA